MTSTIEDRLRVKITSSKTVDQRAWDDLAKRGKKEVVANG